LKVSRYHQLRDSDRLLLRISSFSFSLLYLDVSYQEGCNEDCSLSPVPDFFLPMAGSQQEIQVGEESEVRLIILLAPSLWGCLGLLVPRDLRSWFFTIRLSPFRFL
jgi:hypothetical protein